MGLSLIELRILLFSSNKSDTCDWLSLHLQENHIDCISLNGRMPPSTRKGRMDMYQSGEVGILVCTDVGSRGIDTIRVSC